MKIQVPQGLMALFILICSTSVHASNLLDLFYSAIENDPILKAAQSSKKAGEEAKPKALSKLLPKISVSGHAGKASHDIKNAIPEIEKERQITNEIAISLVLSQPIFNLSTFREQKHASFHQRQSELRYRIAQQDLIFRVADTYFTTLSYKDRFDFARSERNKIAKLVKIAEKRFENGNTEAFQVLEAQAKHDMALAREIKLESQLLTQRDELIRITGTSQDKLMVVKPDAPLIPPSPSNMQNWADSAQEQNLLIAVKKIEADLIKQELDIIRAKRYPTVDLNASYGRNDYGGAYPQNSLDAAITLNLNMTLYDGNHLSTHLREKKHIFERIMHEFEAKKREVALSTRSSYLGIIAGISYIKALNQAINSGEQALRSVNKGFEKGEKSTIDVLNVQQELFKNKQEYANSRYQYILSMLRLKQNVGALSIDDLEQVNSWLH